MSEIIPGKNLKSPVCTLSVGEAPLQAMDVEEVKSESTTLDIGETFYGDENFDLEELDSEGFEGLDDVAPPDLDEGDLY